MKTKFNLFVLITLLVFAFASCNLNSEGGRCPNCGTYYETEFALQHCANQPGCPNWNNYHFQCLNCGNWYDSEDIKNHCANQPGCPNWNGNNEYQGNSNIKIKFNLTDAKALASQEKLSGGRYIASETALDRSAARATEEVEGLLVKILDDGSLASVIEFPEGYNPDDFTITQIAISPSEKSDELYIVINNGSGMWGIGGLLCVKSDGTYYDILNDLRESSGSSYFDLYGNSSDNDYIKFDKLGNMYFQTRSWASNQTTTMIYKYNPKRNETTVLTPAVSGTYYEDYIVSDNGAWIFASAYRWSNNNSTRYLRAIPTANAEQYVNITYSSNGNGYYRNLIYDDENGYLYFNGYVKNNSGIFRIQKKNGTFDSADLKCMSSNNSSGEGNEYFWYWSLVDSKYTNINLSNLLNWKNSSEEVIVPDYKEFISVYSYYFSQETERPEWGAKDFVLVDEDGTLIPENLVSAYLSELRHYCKDSDKTFFTTKDVITDEDKERENSPIQLDFRFDVFADIPGYELLATLTEGKKNEEAFAALDTPEAMCILYKLLNANDNSPYQYKNRIGCYERNFLADITYLKNTDTLLSEINVDDKYFQTKLNGKYYQNNNCVQYIYAKERTWLQKMEWNKDYMSGDTPNYEAILEKFYEYCNNGDKIFSLEAFKDDPIYGGLYTDKKDIEALQYITEADKLYLLQDWLWNGGDEKKTDFLKKTCLFKDTLKPACSMNGGSVYKWKEDLYNEDGSVNTEKILHKFYSSCKDGEKEFNLKYFGTKAGYKNLYTDLIDEEAILFLSNSERLRTLGEYVNSFSNGDEGNKQILMHTCFLKGTEETAYKENSNNGGSWTNWNYSDMKVMAKTSKGIFGSVPGSIWNGNESTYFNTFMKLFDENGIFEMYTIPNSDKYFATEIQTVGDLMVFKNAVLNSNGDETGSHTIQVFDASNSSFKDLFKKVDGSNIEIISYSVGGDYVYFCGVQGLVLISGKINMKTYDYTPIYSTKKMNQIITVTQ